MQVCSVVANISASFDILLLSLCSRGLNPCSVSQA
jgi:hypothetical protein